MTRQPNRPPPGIRRDVLWCLALTIVFETITAALRFGGRLQSTRDTAVLRSVTFGLRIHHGYLGVLCVLLALFVHRLHWQRWILRIGMALVLSDLAHHFLVLWPITGNPEFDLVYPR